jgi:hypothetical protein
MPHTLTLSIATRNDLHEADPHTPLERLQNNLNYVSQYVTDNIQYHIVDWGSDDRVVNRLKVPKNLKTVIYTVPKEDTKAIKSPFPEVLCHNLVMRNTETDFYGRADQDTIVSKKFINWFNSANLHEDTWGWSVRRNLIRERIGDNEDETKYNDDPMFGDCFRCAVGILLLSNKIIKETKGYSEENIQWNHMEHEFIGRLLTHKKEHFKNIGLMLDVPFYHIDHIKTANAIRTQNKTLTDYEISQLPLRINNGNWGLNTFKNIQTHRFNF